MSFAPGKADKALRDVLEIGKLCDENASALPGGRTLPETGLPEGVAQVCEAFGLSGHGRAAFAWCLWRAANLRPFPEPGELAALCAAEIPGEPPALLFSPQAGGLLRAACDLSFNREPRLPGWARMVLPGRQENFHGETLLAEAEAFLKACAADGAPYPALLALTGGPGMGKKFLLAEVCRRRGCNLLVADCAAIHAENLPELAGLALLLNALVCLDRYSDAYAPLVQGLFSWFSLALLSSRVPVSVPDGCEALLEREVPPLTHAQRRGAMMALFHAAPALELDRAATLCRAPVGALVRAAARLRADEAVGHGDGLWEALRRENGQVLSQNAQRMRSEKRLADLVLPAGQMRRLHSLCDLARQRETVWKEWGFGRKLPGGQGITALFYGASGTGKTLAAMAVANELGLPLYRVDLSQLISKYIGETQKNIGKIFDAAQNADCILFFDEADALFSRRTDAADAQDRYANAEIAYLLQRTEQYDGIILLATNLLQNFDEAFRRRIGLMIRFPVPDEAQRERLWRGIFPEEAPLEELDYPLLAKQLELTGAGVRACALNAARMAASQGGGITMTRLADAARDEYEKLGKAFPSAFGQRFPTGKEPD